jgi:hypothetical protein
LPSFTDVVETPPVNPGLLTLKQILLAVPQSPLLVASPTSLNPHPDPHPVVNTHALPALVLLNQIENVTG